MAAKDKNGRDFVVGAKVKVSSSGKFTRTYTGGHSEVLDGHYGGHNPEGEYEGEIVGLHEDGPHVLADLGGDDPVRTTPLAAECEVL